jgi:DNA-binding MarR family transcriptional regulator
MADAPGREATGVRKDPPAAPPQGGSAPLDPLIHGRVRLLILSHLMRLDAPAAFTGIRRTLGLTDGTLSVHLTRLEKGGLISISKEFVRKRPQTLVRLTPEGRRRFQQYVTELREIVPGLV